MPLCNERKNLTLQEMPSLRDGHTQKLELMKSILLLDQQWVAKAMVILVEFKMKQKLWIPVIRDTCTYTKECRRTLTSFQNTFQEWIVQIDI